MVQGVGFRFTARSLANRYKIKGWVRNTSDDKVEIKVQAGEKNLNCFLEELRQEFRSGMTDVQIEKVSLDDKIDGFQIEF